MSENKTNQSGIRHAVDGGSSGGNRNGRGDGGSGDGNKPGGGFEDRSFDGGNSGGGFGDHSHDDSGSRIFGELDAFGLKGADRTKVYGPSAEKAPRPGGASDLQSHIARSLFLRSFKCPVCGAETKVPAIRSSSVRLLRKDSDFMPYYKDPNPLYYFVEFCRMCGFATLPANIKNLTDRQKRQIREKISASWKFEKEYPSYYTPEVAIEIHKLGLYNAVVSNEKESLRAILSLHIGWLYRILGNAENEKIFLATAREGFERAYENESGPVGGLDKSSQQYLIGELLRRTGNLFGALKWYKMVLLDRTARRAVKEMARDQKDQIMALYESSKRPAAE